MKLTIMSLAIAGILLASCSTTHTATSDNAAYNVTVPSGIRSSFAIAYPDATNVVWNSYDATVVPVDWDMTGWTVLDTDDYAVTFDMGGTRYYAWYDSDGTLVGTAYAVTDYSRLPYAVNNLLQNTYRDYTIESVQTESWRSQTAYEVKLKKGDSKLKILIDSNGKVLKEKSKD